jgi:hypothetical protein
MNRIGVYVLLAMLAMALCAGCGDPLKADNGGNRGGNGGGGGGTTPSVPGGGGKVTVENLKTEYNDTPDKPGMRIFNISQAEVNAEEVTTQKTLGLWADDKFHIEGYNTSFNGTYANAGFTDVSLLYYNQPFEGEFKISARIRIVRAGGTSTGKGIHFGAYTIGASTPPPPDHEGPWWESTWTKENGKLTNPQIIEEDGERYQRFGGGQNSKGMGMFLRAEAVPNFRLYYSDQGASTTAGTGALGTPSLTELRLGKEYIYEISRERIDTDLPYGEEIPGAVHTVPGSNPPNRVPQFNGRYTFRLLDSKTYQPVQVKQGTAWTPVTFPTLGINQQYHPVGNTQISMSPALKEAVYAGVCISGTVAEISEIKVWTTDEDKGGQGMSWNYITQTGDTPIFKTPDTTPAYVPANYIMQPNFSPNNGLYVLYNEEKLWWWDKVGTGTDTWTGLVNAGYQIRVTPVSDRNILGVDPEFADENIRFEFYKVSEHFEGPAGAFGIAGVGAAVPDAQSAFSFDPAAMDALTNNVYELAALPGIKLHKTGVIKIDETKIQAGETRIGRFKIVARDLNLDVPPEDGGSVGPDDPNYSLMQTLPEYYFRVDVSRNN